MLLSRSEAVFLHIRRGDYLNKENQKVFAECPLNYFENAANRIKEDIKNVHFFVFSNDIQWVKSHLKLNDNEVTFIQNEGNSCDLKDFYLMTRCKHAIIRIALSAGGRLISSTIAIKKLSLQNIGTMI